MPDKIQGGYILFARKTLESEIMDKPPLYFKLWGWMLLQAKFRPKDGLKRGQFQTSIKEMQEAMSYHVGYRKETPTTKQIRAAYESLTKGSMIGTTKGTGGMIVTILNYNEYQDPKNYEGHYEGHHEREVEGTPLLLEEREERKNVIKNIQQRNEEPAPHLSGEGTTQTVYLTKKKRKLSGKRLESFNRFWEIFNYKKDKANAADAWIDIPFLTNALVETICDAAKRESAGREDKLARGLTPIYAQGWIAARRWEDESTGSPVNGKTMSKDEIFQKYGITS